MEELKSIWQIDEIMSAEIARLVNDNCQLEKEGKNIVPYLKILDDLFKKYKETIKQFRWLDEDHTNLYQIDGVKGRINKYIRGIKKIFEYNSKGKLIEANKEINKLFGITSGRETAEAKFPKMMLPKEQYWFRARDPSLKETFDRKDLFHNPFELRVNIGTSRFSIPGYPCLYLGSSLECVWEETGEQTIAAVSCFRNLTEMEFYDFSFFSSQGKSNDVNYMLNSIISYPFKIASSLPLTPNRESYKYKEEYIIPQLLLHCAIKQRGHEKTMGILYSSTKSILKQIPKEEFSQHLNVVVPSVFVSDKGVCSYLALRFPLTKPEIVPFSYLDKGQLLNIENEMKNKEFKTIDML